MPFFLFRSKIPVSAESLYDWHLRIGALERLIPPWSVLEAAASAEQISDRSQRALRIPVGPFRTTWVMMHHSFVEGRQFVDEQIAGPFRKWIHTHRFIPEGPDSCVLEDAIEYDLPFGAAGRLTGTRGVHNLVHRIFPWRHARTLHDVTRHAKYANRPRLKIAITGASGLIGSNLTHFLTGGGHRVYPLVRRRPESAKGEIHWNPIRGEIDAAALEGMDAVIHLAGKNIGSSLWSRAHLREVRDSRVLGTKLLATTLAKLTKPPQVFISASAIGYYGTSETQEFTEDDLSPRNDFLSRLCVEWEQAAESARQAGIRVVHPRFGLVLTSSGGALKKMLPVFRTGLGGVLAGGRQWMSWIALDDLLGALNHLLFADQLSGPVNLTSPDPVTNQEYTKTIGRVLRRPAILKVPAFVLRTAFGQMADELLISGSKVRPTRLLQSGFKFSTPDLETALRKELGRLDKASKSP